MTETQFVLDTNVIIDLTENKIAPLSHGGRFVSIISEMELFASPSLTQKQEDARRDFLSKVIIVPLTEQIKQEAIRIRRYGTPRLKLPDAIIAAAAVVLDAALATSDVKILSLDWPGLSLVNAR